MTSKKSFWCRSSDCCGRSLARYQMGTLKIRGLAFRAIAPF
ncbi:MAG: hypothetical protein WBA89_16095 [Microcoleus sp.]